METERTQSRCPNTDFAQNTPGAPGAGAERVPVGATQSVAHPDDDCVPPDRQEPQIEHIPTGSFDVVPEPTHINYTEHTPTGSTNEPPPLPPPLTVAKSPPTTNPRSLPAGARVPNNGQRADVQRMSQSSSRGESPGLFSGLASRLSSLFGRSPSPKASAPPTPKQATPSLAWAYSQHVPSLPRPPTQTITYRIRTPSPHPSSSIQKRHYYGRRRRRRSGRTAAHI